MKKLTVTFISLFICISAAAQLPAWQWAVSAASEIGMMGMGIAADSGGNLYSTGFFNGSWASFGNITLTGSGGPDFYIAKVDASGDYQWARSAGGTGGEQGCSIAADTWGNIYVIGYFGSPSVVFGTDTLYNSASWGSDIFIAKYDSAGNFIWARSAGGPDNDNGTGIAIDPDGNILVAGTFESYNGPAFFGTFQLTSSGNTECFAAKYDSSGNVLWVKSFGSTSGDDMRGISSDPSGNVFVTGKCSGGNQVFDTIILVNSGFFLAKYNPAGEVVWARSAGGAGGGEGKGVCSDPAGNIYITGTFTETSLVIGPMTLLNSGPPGPSNSDYFIAKYNTAGVVVWAKSAVGGNTSYTPDGGMSISAGLDGCVWVTGYFGMNSITFGSYILQHYGTTAHDLFAVKYDSQGNVLWAGSAGGANTDDGKGIIALPDGGAALTGFFRSPTIHFGGIVLNNLSSPLVNELFITRINNGGLFCMATATPSSVCQGFSSQLFALATGGIGSYSFAWSPVTGLSDPYVYNPVATPGTTTTYYVTVSDNITSIVDSVTVTVIPIPSLNLGPDSTICHNDTLTLDAGPGMDDYIWSTGDTTQTIQVVAATIGIGNSQDFWVRVTKLDCSKKDTISITVIDCSTGIVDDRKGPSIRVYPNPVSSELTLRTTGYRNAVASLCDVFGRRLLQVEILNGEDRMIDCKRLPPGMYMIIISENDVMIGKARIIVSGK